MAPRAPSRFYPVLNGCETVSPAKIKKAQIALDLSVTVLLAPAPASHDFGDMVNGYDGFITNETTVKMDVTWTYLLRSHPESKYLTTCLRALSEKRMEVDAVLQEWPTANVLPEECSNDPLAILTRYYAAREAKRIADGLDSAGGLDILAMLTQILQSQCQATEPPAVSFLNRNRVVTPLAPAREYNHIDESIVRACLQVEARYRILRLETSPFDLSRQYNFLLTFSRAAPLGCYTSVIRKHDLLCRRYTG